jgi:bis(5'-nucleosidyl)-tetraphosphatase
VKQEYSAGIVLFLKENNNIEYLLLHYYDSHWDFPKGKIDPGETKQQTAHRELLEETGLEAILKSTFEESISYIFCNREKQKTKKTVYFFVGELKEKKEVTLSHEHKNFVWLPFDAALEKLTYNDSKEILQKANFFIKKL